MTIRCLALLLLLAGAPGLQAADRDGTRMLRHPDVHGDQLVFGYAGDLWLATIDGDAPARRLTSHPGLELYPKFSPDGTRVAFTGQYRGDEQVYVIDVAGGEPTQLTFYPAPGPLPARWGTDHQVYDWTPDGSAVLFRSSRQSFNDPRLFRVGVDGGLPEVLPMPRAGSGVYSPDGRRIFYSPLFRDFRTWKRYQGGWAQNLYLYDLERDSSRQLTDHARTERDPVWLESGLYFVSDRDGTLELMRLDPDSGAWTQLTDHDEWDIKWASGHGERIVYEIAGTIGLYDTVAANETLLSITVPDDHVRRTARRIEVKDQVWGMDLSPDGKRVVLEARGDVFTVPVEHGVTRNLTRRGDAHDREAAWSPDGAHIAFVSDSSGEEQLYVIPQEGGAPRALSTPQETRLYRPVWAPDSEALAYHDHLGRIHVTDLAGRHTLAYDSPYGPVSDYEWSPDSRWLTFTEQLESGATGVFLWSRATGDVTLATDGFFNAYAPRFSPDGKHLYFLGQREFAPQIGGMEWNYAVDREDRVYALALTAAAGNPYGPRNDEVAIDDGESADEAETDDEKKDGEESEAVEVAIEFEGLAERVILVPIEADNIFGVTPLADRVLFVTGGPFYYGRSADVQTTLRTFDPETRKVEEVASEIQGLAVSADGKYVLVRKQAGLERIELAKPKEPKSVDLSNLIVYRAPATEWATAFDEVWRRFRDYFYVDNLHGYDWEALRERYRPLLSDVSTREDLNTLIGEMIAELNVGHAYVAGGDLQAPKRSSASLLGARFEADERARRYRIAHIYPGHNEEPKYRSPLTEVGVDVAVGDYLIAIDGRELTTADNPYDLLTDRGNQPVELLVNDRPRREDARRVLVDPIGNETPLVYLEWVERNLAYVSEQTDGRVGYLHVPDMGANGLYEFIKWFYPQLRRQGLIVDVRGNGGGNVSQMLLRRLMQKPLGFGYRAHSSWTGTYPGTAFNGPMVALISENSASDGDIFPFFFREAGLGPLIGKKTWGGTVGITNHGPVIDGGQVFVPEFGLGQPDKGWIIEGEGVAPDIEVANDPAADGDAQLDRGIAEVLERIAQDPPRFPPKPPAPDKTD